ncbi:MAG: hypothetical protein N2511_04480 [Thermodesulfovibrionales bacterium]|nr:hypothetical protein [Thermodesulfovibrionales bacterium]
MSNIRGQERQKEKNKFCRNYQERNRNIFKKRLITELIAIMVDIYITSKTAKIGIFKILTQNLNL